MRSETEGRCDGMWTDRLIKLAWCIHSADADNRAFKCYVLSHGTCRDIDQSSPVCELSVFERSIWLDHCLYNDSTVASRHGNPVLGQAFVEAQITWDRSRSACHRRPGRPIRGILRIHDVARSGHSRTSTGYGSCRFSFIQLPMGDPLNLYLSTAGFLLAQTPHPVHQHHQIMLTLGHQLQD